MLRIRDVYPGSRILIFTHPGSRISDPGSQIQKQVEKRGVKKKFLSNIFDFHFNLDLDPIFSLKRIRILFLTKVMRICDHFEALRLHCERLWPSSDPFKAPHLLNFFFDEEPDPDPAFEF